MVIYGVALLAFCLLTGTLAGDVLGRLLGIEANVGGVGISMLLLLYFTSRARERWQLNELSQSGIAFWSAMYIPIVVAMAAKQNVAGAIESGWLALFAGVLAVVVSFMLTPLLSRIAHNGAHSINDELEEHQ
ncbi:MAG: malonate transporter subunit MadL [Porticoccaceae bacterium]|jgi:malonate transporter MadL subunit|nr:malonate transporter subunit MadL [Porticoccaceae bacterium]|tara:strand:+ start:5769 stop:6164 length:396 start_codon:yes stop_codon:yes gene_type:complete